MTSSKSPPSIVVDPDWEEVELPFGIGSGRSLFSVASDQEIRFRMNMFRRRSSKGLVGRVWFGEGAHGPPGHVHGGAAAYVLDEAMGTVGWMNDYPVVAAKLEFELHRMSPLFVDLHIEAKVIGLSNPKRLAVEATLALPSGEPCVTGRGEFAVLSRDKTEKTLGLLRDPIMQRLDARLKWAVKDET